MNKQQIVEILSRYGEDIAHGELDCDKVAEEILKLHKAQLADLILHAGEVVGSAMASQEGIERRKLT